MRLENTPTLETERLRLRKFTHQDLDALWEIVSDKQANVFLPWFFVESKAEAMQFLEARFLAYYLKPSAYRYAICLKETNQPIGYVWVSGTPSNDLGYGLRADFWQRGLATEAALAVVERVRQAGFAFVTATHDTQNPQSGKVMKKLGMTYRYSYHEQWQPKNIPVVFRLYQRNFSPDSFSVYRDDTGPAKVFFVEKNV